MPKFVAALLLLFVGVVPAGVPVQPADFSKCPLRVGGDPDMLDAIVLLDNEISDYDAEEFNTWFRSEGAKIHSVEIVCWSWVEANFDVHVRSGAVYTLTRAWVDRTRNDRMAALEAVVAAQGRHLEQTGGYTAVVEDLPGFGTLADYGLPGHLLLDLATTDEGWSARLVAKDSWTTSPYTHMSPLHDCFAFAGAVPAEWEELAAEEETVLAERTPVCF